MIYEMKLIEDEFNNVKHGKKIIEVRINDEKRRNIIEGDQIVFHKLSDMKEIILVKVEQVHKFCTFKELYENFPISYFGYDKISITDMLDKIYRIYTKEEERNCGVVAIKIDTKE